MYDKERCLSGANKHPRSIKLVRGFFGGRKLKSYFYSLLKNKIMEDKKINGLIIVDDKQTPIGAMNMHDLLSSGVL